MKKRMFQVLDEMNAADAENNTAHVAICNHLVSARTVKGGGHVTMGVPAEYILRLATDKNCIALLLVVDKAEYEKMVNTKEVNNG